MSFLDRQNTVAGPGFSRWLVPPAALAIHLSIGQVYAFSVFKIPLSQLIGVTKPVAAGFENNQTARHFSPPTVVAVVACVALAKCRVDRAPPPKPASVARCFLPC